MRSSTTFAGWIRCSSEPWQRVCEGADSDACWSALLAHPAGCKSAERLVLPAGEDPNRPRKGRKKGGR